MRLSLVTESTNRAPSRERQENGCNALLECNTPSWHEGDQLFGFQLVLPLRSLTNHKSEPDFGAQVKSPEMEFSKGDTTGENARPILAWRVFLVLELLPRPANELRAMLPRSSDRIHGLAYLHRAV